MFASLRWLWIFTTLHNAAHSTKWMMDSPGFNDASAWLSGYLPCARELAVFPENYGGVMPLPQQVDVGGFVLPKDGAMLLHQETTITLGGEAKKRDCGGGTAYLKAPPTRRWFDPRSWRSDEKLSRNKAVTDMERVPCNNESVVIGSGGAMSFDLENTPYLRLGQLNFAGSLLSKDYMQRLMNTELGMLLFRNQVGVTIEYYHNDVCGCHRDFNNFIEPICHNVLTTCEHPHCLVAVVPFGSCCAICGSVLKFLVQYCENEKLHKLRRIIVNAIRQEDLEDILDYHVNYVSSSIYGNYLQAIVVDRYGYDGRSVKFIKALNESTDWTKELFAGASKNLEIQFSGRPYNPNITFTSILLIILCLLLVSFVALVIFAHYSPDNRYLLRYVPQWVYDPRRWRVFVTRSNFVFARFENVAPSGGGQTDENDGGSVVRQNIIMGYDAESGEVRERAFDNPLFGGHPTTSPLSAREQNSEVSTDSKQESGVTLESVSFVDVLRGEEEQELTEIKLDTSSDEEGNEDETKE